MPTISLTAADGHRLTAYRAGPQNAARALVFAMLLEISSTRLGLHPDTGTADRIRAQLDLVLHGILSKRSEPTPGRLRP